MHWVDSLVDLGANMVSPSELRWLAAEIADLGFACHEVRLGNVEKLLAIGVKPEKLRPVIPLDITAMISAQQRGVKTVRLIKDAGPPEAVDALVREATDRQLTVVLTMDLTVDIDRWKCLGPTGKAAVVLLKDTAAMDAAHCEQLLRQWRKAGMRAFEYWGSNRYGMATANSLAAMRHGAVGIIAAVAGIDGGTPWEEAAGAREFLLGQGNLLAKDMVPRCRRVADFFQREIALNKPILGDNIFAHESGIHVDGVIKNPVLYEPFRPEQIGQKRRIILGTHSGRAAVACQLEQLGLDCSEERLRILVQEVQNLARRQGFGIYSGQLGQLHEQLVERQGEMVCELAG